MQSSGYVSGTLTAVWVQVGHLNRWELGGLILNAFFILYADRSVNLMDIFSF